VQRRTWLIPSSFTNPVVATTGLHALLVVEHELARVEDRPQHVFYRALLVLRSVNVLRQLLLLGRGGRAPQGGEVKFLDHIAGRRLVLEELRDAAVAVGDLV